MVKADVCPKTMPGWRDGRKTWCLPLRRYSWVHQQGNGKKPHLQTVLIYPRPCYQSIFIARLVQLFLRQQTRVHLQ